MSGLLKMAIAMTVFFTIDYIGSEILLEGLNRGFNLNCHSEVLVVGHSRMMMGIDRNALECGTGLKVSKYTRSGVTLPERDLMVRQYLHSGYADSLRVAILGVDCFSFSDGSISSNCYTLFYPYYSVPEIDAYLRRNATALEYWQHRLFRLSRFGDDLINLSVRGWQHDDLNYKTSGIDMEEFHRQSAKWRDNIELRPDLTATLRRTIESLTRRGVRVYLVNTPTLDELTRGEKVLYDSVMNCFQNIACEDGMVEFVDFTDHSSDYSIFFDPIHLNARGQKMMTDSLIKRLRDDLAIE